MSDKMALTTTLREDRAEVTLELHQNDAPIGHIRLEAPELEGLIHHLAANRAGLIDQVPRELDPGTRLNPIVDPVWRAQPDDDGGVLLAIRHPGLGWLSFVLPQAECKNMAKYLLDHSE